jgi:hypothetical protein
MMWLSILLALLIAITAFGGLFWQPTYARETPLWAAEGMGGDAVNLLIVTPVLLLSAILMRKGSISARLMWTGTLVYLLYNFLIYAMAVHFNALFLVYCGILGFSFFGLAGILPSLLSTQIAARYGQRAPVKSIAAVFFLIALVFGGLWLGEIIPAMLSGQTPQSVVDTGLLTNPVHVLDLAFLLPAFAITGFMLLRRRPAAFILAPILMVFGILMTIAIAGMMVAMARKGFTASYIASASFFASAAALTLLLLRYLRA